MNAQLNRKSFSLIYGIPAAIVLTSIFLATGFFVNIDASLAAGIIYDLTITSPLAYLILIWRTEIPKITVFPVFFLGFIIATLVIPENQSLHLDIIKSYLLPLVELIILGVIVLNVVKTGRVFKDLSKENSDFYLLFKESALAVTNYPKIANILATELAVIYYSLFCWRKRKISENQFTGFNKNAVSAILGTVVFLILIETLGLHIFLIQLNETIAWIIFGISIYTALQLLGHIKAIRRRFTEINSSFLILKYGLFGDVKIPLSNINKIELTSRTVKKDNITVEKLALLNELESHNVAIYLSKKVKIQKAYGIEKECDTILFFIDNKSEFEAKLNALIK